MEDILKIFNPQDESELKQAFKDIIINQFKNDFEENSTYLFDPNTVEEMVEDSFREVINEIKGEYKEILRSKMLILAEKDIDKLIKSKK